jgi:hypothetical protein
MKMSLSVSGSTMFGVVTNITGYSGSQNLTLYCGTDYSIPNSALTNVCYSTHRAPFGFPLNPDKWTISFSSNSLASQSSPTQSVPYNVGSFSLTIPIGLWKVSFGGLCGFLAASTMVDMYASLSTSGSVMGSDMLTAGLQIQSGAGGASDVPVYRENIVNLTTKTIYYLLLEFTNAVSVSAIRWRGFSATYIKAVCGYL